MTTFGHALIVLMWIAGIYGATLGLMWLRWQRDKRRVGDAEHWKRQPP